MDVLAAASAVRAASTSFGSPPTTEKGTALRSAQGGTTLSSLVGSGSYVEMSRGEDLEHVPDLRWKPRGKGLVAVYHRMRSDAQCQGIYLGLTLPVRRYNYFFEPNGSKSQIVERVSKSYNLPIRGKEDQPRGRSKRRFVWNEHLRHALLSVIYGHMFFEQVGDIVDGKWVVRKLGPRMPHSIIEINRDKDGGLKSIVQDGMGTTASGKKRTLDVNRLIAYVFEREGGNWTGRSLFRGIYKNFLLKDTVLRVGAINIERAGGIPVIIGPKGASPSDLAELSKMARQFRVGANAGGAIPNGSELVLARAAGGEEAVNYIKLMNEEMSRGTLMMFMNLGQATTGSYALSGNLIDYVLNSQETIADFVVDTFNEHQIEDDVDWNEGPQEEFVPLVGYRRQDDRQMPLGDLVSLVDKGVITVDEELESWLREEYRMPRKSESQTTPAAGSPPPGSSGVSETIAAAADKVARMMRHDFESHLAEALSEQMNEYGIGAVA